MKKNIRLILPVYNESEGIEKFFNKLSKILKSIKKYKFNIFFIVDKSTDRTEEIVSRIILKNKNLCSGIFLSKRYGHQESLLAGIHNSKSFDAIIMMDVDFQHPVECIPKLLNEYEKGFNIVNTVRTNNNFYNLIKKFFNFFYYKLIVFFGLPDLQQNSSDFRLIDKKIIKIISKEFKESSFFLRGLLSNIGFKKTSVIYNVQKREYGISKYSLSRLFILGFDSLVSYSNKPLYIIFILGLVLCIFFLLLFGYFLIDYFTIGIPVKGWTSLFLLIIFFGSVQIFFLGIVSVYVAKIYYEVKKRPNYIVEKKL